MNFTDFKFLDLSKPQKFKYLQNSFFLKNAFIKKTQQNPLARTKRSVLLWYWGKFIHVKEVTIIMQNIIFRKKIFEKFKSFQPLATTRWTQECHWNIFKITWAIIYPHFILEGFSAQEHCAIKGIFLVVLEVGVFWIVHGQHSEWTSFHTYGNHYVILLTLSPINWTKDWEK